MQTPAQIRALLREFDEYKAEKISAMEQEQAEDVRRTNGSVMAALVEAGLIPAKRTWWQRLFRQRLAIGIYAAIAASAVAGTTWYDWNGNPVYYSMFPMDRNLHIPIPLPGPSYFWPQAKPTPPPMLCRSTPPPIGR